MGRLHDTRTFIQQTYLLEGLAVLGRDLHSLTVIANRAAMSAKHPKVIIIFRSVSRNDPVEKQFRKINTRFDLFFRLSGISITFRRLSKQLCDVGFYTGLLLIDLFSLPLSPSGLETFLAIFNPNN